jgi:hypothetical protein
MRPFSAAHPPIQPYSQYFLQPSLLFPSELHRKSCGKSFANSARKSCAKDVEKTLIFCGFRLESLCKTLRITCEEPAD